MRLGRLILRFAPVLLLLTLVPALVGVWSGDGATGWPLLPAAGIALWLCWLAHVLPAPDDASLMENTGAVALAFPLAVLASSAPYLTHGLGVLDAGFEGMSGVTSTGLTRYGDVEAQPFGLLFLRAWQEWVGGFAIVTLAVALLPHGSGQAALMADADVDDGTEDDHPPNRKARARRVMIAYAALTVVCILAVMASGQDARFSVLHGLTAISTGGFSSRADSLADVAPGTVLVLSVFMVLGAVALSSYVRPLLGDGGWRKLAWTMAGLLALTGVWAGVMVWAEGGDLSAYDAVQVAVSAQTTTGFSAISVPDLTPLSKLALTASMAIGGDAGSTAGGLKLVRVFGLIVLLAAVLRARSGGPEGPLGVPARADGDARDGLRLVAWWGAVSVAGLAILLLAGHPPVDALFEWMSALNTVGLSVGVSGDDPSAITRIVLILGMWIGRVEVFGALLVLGAIRRRA